MSKLKVLTIKNRRTKATYHARCTNMKLAEGMNADI